MTDNQLPGKIEDFVTRLIPENDESSAKATQILGEIETEQLNKYADIHRAKACIHTWLAWQEKPGRSMGQSITTRVLPSHDPFASTFVDWLRQLFTMP